MSGPDHLARIAGFGNRGHTKRDNDIIRCRDGFELSVLAGGEAFSTPGPQPVSSVLGGPSDNLVSTDHPGPFSAVDVMPYGTVPDSWDHYCRDDIFAHVPVELVRALIQTHGGEV